jgi:hypothetical protein
MKIIPLDTWNAPGNHDGFRQPRDVVNLIEQVKSLPGIATKDYKGVPTMIRLFAEKCLYGDRPIYVVKGIHQRWGKNPQPHFRIRFHFTSGPDGNVESVDMHVQLSEQLSTWSKDNYSWKTVGITYVVGNDTKQSWPAVYSQEVGNIQQEGRNPAGYKFKRRMSVGCLPPPAEPAAAQ